MKKPSLITYPRRWSDSPGELGDSYLLCNWPGEHLWVYYRGKPHALDTLFEDYCRIEEEKGRIFEWFSTGDGEVLPLSRYPRRWRNWADNRIFYQVDEPNGFAFMVGEKDGEIHFWNTTGEVITEAEMGRREEVYGPPPFPTRADLERYASASHKRSKVAGAFIGSILKSAERSKDGSA